jgi:type II secretory ATPase GspE/PulE/Tfp pilus assembly ATPase PilB-like protein
MTPVKLVDDFLLRAVAERASDVHVEPRESECVIRIRVDGDLLHIGQYKKVQHEEVVARLKVLASLRTDVRTVPQDGRFKVQSGATGLHVRLSVVPTFYGEKCVLRLLTQQTESKTLESLGFVGADVENINRAISAPHGMVLAVGPTGSGKTTTLYALLGLVAKPDVSVVTLEDPIEYSVPHISQIPVQSHGALTFASALRSVVRQDPDIIMVGEIRDTATAELSVHAALTGHLVLSTLHTNDAVTSIVRCIEMGVEPFLVASALRVVVSQRLVRRPCARCSVEAPLSSTEIDFISRIAPRVYEMHKQKIEKIKIRSARGCVECRQTGFLGRSVVAEVMVVDNKISQLITRKASTHELAEAAVSLGMKPIIDNAIESVFAGATTMSEVHGLCNLQ